MAILGAVLGDILGAQYEFGRAMLYESVLFLIALQHDYGCLQSTYCVLYFSQLRGYTD